MADIKTIAFGKQAQEIIKALPAGHTIQRKDRLHLIVTDEAAQYETNISAYIEAYTDDHNFMVLDLCMASDSNRYKQLWTHYNKVNHAAVVRNMFLLVDRYIVVGSLTSFDFRDVLSISDAATTLDSCYSDKGIAGLSSLNVDKDTVSMAVGVGFANPHEATMEELNRLGTFLDGFEHLGIYHWFLSLEPGEELIVIYSTTS